VTDGPFLVIDGIFMRAGAMSVSIGGIDLKRCQFGIRLEGILSLSTLLIGLSPDILIHLLEQLQAALTP
jgi:hypothetical protein